MMIKQEENLLPKIFLDKLVNILESNNFQWYFQKSTLGKIKESSNNFMFTHNLFNNHGQLSEWFTTFEPVVYYISEKYEVNKLLRMKLNLYTNQHKNIKHTPHTDFKEKENIKVGLLNFTTCDGGTNIGKKVYRSKRNELIVFDNSEKHYGITQTDTQTRITLNIGWK